jgi:hypothetical protein
MIIKYKEGTLDALSNGWEQDYHLYLYKDTVLSEDGTFTDFTDATATSGYSVVTLAWGDATISWDSVTSKYKAVWDQQNWSAVTGLDADGWFISDSADNRVYAAEAKVFGEDYTILGVIPSIIMG